MIIPHLPEGVSYFLWECCPVHFLDLNLSGILLIYIANKGILTCNQGKNTAQNASSKSLKS